MKLKSKIPLATRTFAGEDGEPKNDTRTVEVEINRLRNTGMLDAANRLESSTEDALPDHYVYQEIDPTTSKAYVPAK